jgi:hypothetical protein
MTGWAVLIAFLLAPLACWALLARTKVLGWAFAIVFAAYAVTEGGLMAGGWPFRDEPAWLLAGLPVMSVVALAAGTLMERHEVSASEPGWGARGAVGLFVSTFYGLAVIGGAAILLGMLTSQAPATPAVPIAAVEPLGPGLAITQQDMSCDAGRDPQCTAVLRIISTSGRSGQAVLESVRSQLTQDHGWQLISRGGTMFGCREFDGQDVWVQFGRVQNGVEISLGSSLDPDNLGC